MKNEWVDEDQITRLLVYPLFAPPGGGRVTDSVPGGSGGYRVYRIYRMSIAMSIALGSVGLGSIGL